VASGLAHNIDRSRPHTRPIFHKVDESLQSEGFDDGTAIFELAVQRGNCNLPFPRVQFEPRNQDGQMPAQLLLLSLGHQA